LDLAFSGLAILGALGTPPVAFTQETPALKWTPCEFDESDLVFMGFWVDPSRLRCGWISVPEDRGRTGGRTLRLAFAVIEAERRVPGAVPVVYLHGGPGGRALEPYFLAVEGPALAVEFDAIAFDQRGAGRSEPDLCRFLAAAEVDIAARELTPAEEVAGRRKGRRACLDDLERRGIDPGSYDMEATVADLEDLRRALGYERWSLLGRSYGGALAQRILRRHPDTLHGVVLVNPSPLDWSNFDQEVPSIAATLARVFRGCASDPSCRAAFPDPESDLYRTWDGLRQRPWTIPVDVSLLGSPTFVINATDFMWMVNDLLYGDFDIQHLPSILHAFAERDAHVAAAVAERVFAGWSEGAPATVASVCCRDVVTEESPARSEAAAAPYPEALRDVAFIHLEICEDWPVAPGPPESRHLVETDVPALILSGGYDHIVPAWTGAAILRGMTSGRQVVFDSSSHILPSAGNAECAFQIMRDFLADPRGPLETDCVAAVPPLRYSTELPEWAR
jgi:pimeloyl-ACP methyl ester carboxylesterase